LFQITELARTIQQYNLRVHSEFSWSAQINTFWNALWLMQIVSYAIDGNRDYAYQLCLLRNYEI